VVRHLKVSSKLRGSNVPLQTVDGEASKHILVEFLSKVMKRVSPPMG